MYIIASFEYSALLELAITALEQKNIPKERILAIPLDKRTEPARVFDTIHRADGISMFDGAALLGAACMTLGAVYGFILKWGPIIWGLIGLFTGAAIGFIFDYFIGRRRRSRGSYRSPGNTEVMLMIRCEDVQVDMVEQILWEHHALGLAKLQNYASSVHI